LKHSNAMLEDFLNNAPPAQQVPPSPRWQKYHRKYNEASLNNKAGDGFFQRIIKKADGNANFIERPETFEGRMTRAPSGNGLTPPAKVELFYQMAYFQNSSCTLNDRRVVYSNVKYPWVIGMHRYRLCTGMPNEPDVARVTFPVGTAPGRYVVQWQWRGYYDVIDVEIVAGTTPVALPYGVKVPPPPAGQPAQYKRVDHCAFPDASPVNYCYRMVTDARACMDMCDRVSEIACQGVGIVPVLYPRSAYVGFKNISLLPYDFSQTCRKGDIEKGATANHLACFPARARDKTETTDRFYVTNDPEDPAFYSTCLLRIPYKDSAAGPIAQLPRDPAWQFRSKCIGCEDAQISTLEFALMNWNISSVCANCDVDGPQSVAAVPKADLPQNFNNQSTTPWTKRMPNAYCNGLNGDSNVSANYACTVTTNCILQFRPPGNQNGDVSERDCFQLTKADGRCGPTVFQRKIGDENPSLCWCWRGGTGGDQPCCGDCDVKLSGAYRMYQL